MGQLFVMSLLNCVFFNFANVCLYALTNVDAIALWTKCLSLNAVLYMCTVDWPHSSWASLLQAEVINKREVSSGRLHSSVA